MAKIFIFDARDISNNSNEKEKNSNVGHCEERMNHLIRINKWGVFFAILFGFFVCSCTIHEPRPVQLEELNEIHPQKILKKETFVKPPAPTPFAEKMEPITKGLAEKARLYSLVFESAPLGEIINALLADVDYNLSVESGIDLTKPVTVRMKNVTLREALDMVIVKGSDYAWKIDDGFVHVKRFEETVYHLDYLDIGAETDIDVGGDMLASSVADAGVAGKFSVKAKRSAKRNDVWAEIQESLEALKSTDGILRLNRNAGVIYMADTPMRIDTMVSFLDTIAESLHRQVFIEAKIMEVKLNDDHKFGIDWTNVNVLFEDDFGFLPDDFQLFVNGGSSFALAQRTSFSAIVDFLRTQGDVSVLSNPHLAVMNGQSAVFTVGFQFPFGDISGVDQDLETNVITFRSSIKRVILGLQLGLMPQISNDGIISLLIVPTITRIKDEVDVDIPLTATQTQSISNPVIDLQELATTVRVREGQTVVLAGLINQIKNLEHEGLPWFNKLPLLRNLFGRIGETYENSELVIFFTPYIKSLDS